MGARRTATPIAPADVAARVGAVAGRAACTDAERRAARLVSAELRARGLTVTSRTAWVRPYWAPAWALLALAGVVGSVLSVSQPAAGLIVAVVALALFAGEATERAPLVRRVLPARATEVVAGTAAGREQPVTLVLAADVDAPRAGWLRRVPRPELWIGGALALVVAAAAARVAGAEGTALGAAQLVPSVVLLAAVALLLDATLAAATDGRDAAGGLAAALRVADALAGRPPRHLGVTVVAAGAGGARAAGLRWWLREQRRAGVTPRDMALLHLMTGAGDAPRWSSRGHPQLRAAAAAAGAALPELDARPAALTAVSLGRWPVLGLGGDEEPVGTLAVELVDRLDAELR